MRRFLTTVAMVCVVAATAAGCRTGDTTIPTIGPTWHITSVYINPDTPAQLPADSAGQALMVFAQSSFTGSMGCGPMRGPVTFSTEHGSPADGDVATVAKFGAVTADTSACQGASLFYAHHILTTLSGHTFHVERHTTGELVLKQTGDDVDPLTARTLQLMIAS